MLKQQARLVAFLIFGLDLALVTAAFLAAYLVRSRLAPHLGWGASGAPGLYPLGSYLPLLPLALALWSLLLWSSGRYRSHRRVPLVAEAVAVLRVCILGAAGFGGLVWALRLDERLLAADRISRSWVLLFALFSAVFLLAEKLALRLAARRLREKGLNFRTILLVGTGATAGALADAVREHRFWGYRVLGSLRVDEGAPAADLRARPVLGELGQLDSILAEQIVDEIVFAVPPRDMGRYENLLLRLQDQGIVVRFALDLLPHTRGRVELDSIEGIPLVSLAVAPGTVALAAKRAFDLLAASLLLLVAVPVMLAIATAVRLAGGGEVLFRQRRCGLNGRIFTLYKFRTMVAGAHRQLSEVSHLNEMNGPVFKARNDPRITRLGRFLRRFSLDELPQLWNVLRGDMSLVGPRPPIPEEVERYERWQRRRLSMKPGLTCLWQVSGRNQLDFDRWMALDLQYIDTWSPWLDLKILARTVPVVISGRGAS